MCSSRDLASPVVMHSIPPAPLGGQASAAARPASQGLTGVPVPLRPRPAGQGGKAARRVPKSEPALGSSPRCLDSPPGLARPPAVECVSAMCHRPRLWENAAPLTSQQLARARPPGSRETGAARPGGRPGPLPSVRRLSAHTPVPARDPGLRRHPQRVAQHALLLPPLALCILPLHQAGFWTQRAPVLSAPGR